MAPQFSDRAKVLFGLTEEDCAPVKVAPAPKSVSAAFIPPSWYPELDYALCETKGAAIFGPRGSGKSTAIRELARSYGKQWETLQCAANMQIDSLIGCWSVVAGSTVWIDGKLTRCARAGKWLLAEEANAIHPGVWSQVNTLTDATGEPLALPTGEEVPCHPDFRLILLYNDGYEGTREVNPALKDRLMPVLAEYPSVGVETAMLSQMRPALASYQVDRLIACAQMIRAANIRNFDLSIRALDRWAGLYLRGVGTWEECYRIAVLNLVGAPNITGPQRAVLTEIARQCGMEVW